MSIVEFQCEKCGTCCRDLIEEVNDFDNGLFLTTRDSRLFPSKMISPHGAIGKNRPRHIVSYQLNLSICPHLIDLNKCRIYDQRPLACKSFPLETTRFGSTASLKCPVIKSLMNETEKRPIEWSIVESDASQRIYRYLSNRSQKYGKKDSKLWNFDLRTKRWKAVGLLHESINHVSGDQ